MYILCNANVMLIGVIIIWRLASYQDMTKIKRTFFNAVFIKNAQQVGANLCHVLVVV